MADKKIGAYVCKGCGLGERLNTQQLEMIATREGKAAFAKSHDFLCSQAGVDMINADLSAEGVTHVMIAACSRRAKTDAFRFDNVALTRANLREGVIWVRPDSAESRAATQEMADDYVRMACAEVRHMDAPQPSEEQGLVKHLLVVGGGITGMTTALEAAKAGYTVSIVEKSGQLGGVAAQLYRRIPNRAPYASPVDNGVAELSAAVAADPRITVYLNAQLTRTSGAPGRFAADISQESGATITEQVGAIVQASGFTPYDANQLPELGYGKSVDVVDQLGLEALACAANGAPIKRPSDGKAVQSVLFIQCAGQRSQQAGHLSY